MQTHDKWPQVLKELCKDSSSFPRSLYMDEQKAVLDLINARIKQPLPEITVKRITGSSDDISIAFDDAEFLINLSDRVLIRVSIKGFYKVRKPGRLIHMHNISSSAVNLLAHKKDFDGYFTRK